MQAKIWNHSEWIEETDPVILFNRFDDALQRAGFKVIECVKHWFQPQGFTALWLLAESHFAIHTFPECGKTYIELSSCNLEYYTNFLKEITG